uniref:Uncharacterized protein n=1 Tax=Meloidogyne enterolobii TaxID=390850 RepID=A0A6V7UN75_MELEN|nr:unnamed protein product [Meloidogyne enterolobii]
MLLFKFPEFRQLINQRGSKSQIIQLLEFNFDDIRSILLSTNDPMLVFIKIDVFSTRKVYTFLVNLSRFYKNLKELRKTGRF